MVKWCRLWSSFLKHHRSIYLFGPIFEALLESTTALRKILAKLQLDKNWVEVMKKLKSLKMMRIVVIALSTRGT